MLVAHLAALEHGLRCHGGMGMSVIACGKEKPARWGCPTCAARFGEVMQRHELCLEACLALPGHKMWGWLGICL